MNKRTTHTMSEKELLEVLREIERLKMQVEQALAGRRKKAILRLVENMAEDIEIAS